MQRILLLAVLGALFTSFALQAEPPTCAPPVLIDPSINDPDHTMKRAGYPQKVACFAQPSETKAYLGYSVGGGCPFHHAGDHPYPTEGTWGWDYQGCVLPRRVFLYWWHKCYQGGTGAYKTDGPQLHVTKH